MVGSHLTAFCAGDSSRHLPSRSPQNSWHVLGIDWNGSTQRV